jgi:hypothetical protein
MSQRTITLAIAGLLASVAFASTAAAQEQADAAPALDPEIAGALAPLPDHLRAGATVMGYRDGHLVMLREGTNGLICLGDKAEQEGFHAACYHKDLEPFMARGRALTAEGHERPAIDSLRQAEIESGTLPFPKEPRALYNVWSEHEFDPSVGEAPESGRLHVVYTPYATEESTGFSATPANNRPWLMYAGKPWAHLMISVK